MRRLAGFTFLEVIISLTIMALVVVVTYGALRLGIQAAARGEERKEENQRMRAALSLIRRQLKSVYPYPIQDQGESFVYFIGETEGVSFISSASRPEAGGFEKVTYFLQGQERNKELWVRTSAPVLPADLVEDREGALSQEALVLTGVEEISWEYLWDGGDKVEWWREWSGKEERTIPKAVRVTWQTQRDGLSQNCQMVVLIAVDAPPRGVTSGPARLGTRRR
jgi:type II secretion system protein J